ncbi:MAG: carbamoyltransferase, partial [Candidatus Omnitrophica bacterium]|nr:carbamoyltransferase [Candidatus Omnitrophota bacterium]
MNILGISCFYHDAAAAILQGGKIIAAAQEERFTRKKHDSDFPENAINYCLKEAGISVGDLDCVAFYDKPLIKFERILYTYFATFPKSFRSFLKSMPLWLHQKLWITHEIREKLKFKGPLYFTEHHESHAASCFLVSPFERAAIITADGVGEWATTSCGIGEGKHVKILKEIRFPHSLGLLYSAFTYYLGFRVNSAEYKVMGLAPYGKPEYYDLILQELVELKDDGSFKLNMKYFAYDYGLTMTNWRFDRLFGSPPRKAEGPVEERHENIAASIQKVTEEIMLRMARSLYEETKCENLCMAGGVALNCTANGRILRETPFKDIWIQPAAGDAGGAVGACAFAYHSILGKERAHPFEHAYLGPAFSDEDVEVFLKSRDIRYMRFDRPALAKRVAEILARGKVIGWFEGRMEFGPRALGSRSILADARDPKAKDIVNAKIKFRESFRPFAPSVLAENCEEYFEQRIPSPYMLFTAPVKKRVIPAVTHVDGTARLQTVRREDNPSYYDTINAFYKLTGCPVILNTSFNLRGEPIVHTPEEAYTCFMRSEL